MKKTVKSKELALVQKESDLSSVKNALTVKEKELISSNERAQKLDNQLNDLRIKSKAQQDEIDRVSSITWYQKLFGKK